MSDDDTAMPQHPKYLHVPSQEELDTMYRNAVAAHRRWEHALQIADEPDPSPQGASQPLTPRQVREKQRWVLAQLLVDIRAKRHQLANDLLLSSVRLRRAAQSGELN